MIKNKTLFLFSLLILLICCAIIFPFPHNPQHRAEIVLLGFTISNQNGTLSLGILGAILFVAGLVLLGLSVNKYRARLVIITFLIYALLPSALIDIYQKTLANGIYSIEYDGKGKCIVQKNDDNKLQSNCMLTLINHSSKPVSFEISFFDATYSDFEIASLMNLAGPHYISMNAKENKFIDISEMIDTKALFEGGSSTNIHIKLIDGKYERKL